MNLRLLSTGATAYAGLIIFSWIWSASNVYIPATRAIIPTLLLAGISIATTILGLVVKRQAGFNRVRILMVSGLFLGVFGFLSWFQANDYNYHIADVCEVGKLYPDGAEWACPQVQAASQIPWIIAVSLVVPVLLFFVAPYLSLSQEHKLHQTPENQ